MRILVTGREGQLATSMIERAGAREVVALGRPELDLADPASIEAAVARVAPDLIVNAAAYTAVDKAEDEPELAAAVNAVAPGVLAAAAKRAGGRLLQVSTDYVFDGTRQGAYREDDPVAPLGVYGATKLAGEEAVAAGEVPYAIVRTAWVYSPFGANFVKTMLRLAGDRDEIAVVADQYGSPTSALDLADAIYRLADVWRDRPLDRVVHAAGSGTASWADVARATFAASAAAGGPSAAVRDITTADYPTRARRPANSVLDGELHAELTGWRMPDWRESLAGTVRRLVG